MCYPCSWYASNVPLHSNFPLCKRNDWGWCLIKKINHYRIYLNYHCSFLFWNKQTMLHDYVEILKNNKSLWDGNGCSAWAAIREPRRGCVCAACCDCGCTLLGVATLSCGSSLAWAFSVCRDQPKAAILKWLDLDRDLESSERWVGLRDLVEWLDLESNLESSELRVRLRDLVEWLD